MSSNKPNQNQSSKNTNGGIQRRNFWRMHSKSNFYNRQSATKQNLVLSEKNLQINGNASCSSSVSVGPENRQPPCVLELNNHKTPYAGWKLYFPNEKYSENSLIVVKLKAFESHINKFSNQYDFQNVKKYFWFSFNLTTINNDENFKNSWSNFIQDLVEKPEETLNICGLGVHQYVSKNIDIEPTEYQTPKNSQNECLKAVRPRIQGFGPVVSLRSLKVNCYDRLVAIRGTIIKVSAPENVCTWMAFRCSSCEFEQSIRQPEGVFTPPLSCKGGCRSRSNFQPILSSPYTKTEAFQIIRLQESMLGEQYETGRVPRSIEAELTEDLVDSLCPGDDITITGILKVKPQEELKQKGHAGMYKMYIRAVSVMSNKNPMSNRKSEFTEKDMAAIKLISEEPCLIRLLVHSLCPAIYGHEMVKAGLLLGLFGGSNLQNARRAEIHVLVVGDPGLGKSQILKACANVSPRGVFVCSKSSSSAGLTVSVRHEKGGGSRGSLEAGALVLADQGTCCIDEFDKMTSNHQSLLEVMEQQTVSVAKAGLLCSLPARTSILAAANPAGGHYDRSKTVSENLKMNPALLSRFDLVFILLDRPNPQLDNLLMAHIQSLHTNNQKPSSTNSFLIDRINTNYINQNQTVQADDQPLYERLKINKDEHIDALPHVLLQKYIAYAKKNIHPTLTPEAAEELKKFYLEMRKTRFGVDSIPVTPRQLEALVRLTQARARLELSNEVQLRHALDVLEIIRHSMIDVLINDDGALQMERNINGAGMSQTSQAKKFLKILQIRSNSLNKTDFDFNELKDLAGQVGVTDNFVQILDSLNLQGFLLKKGKSIYKFLVD